jgi:predicted  nucleic acid-binding Zn-ribbon protein
MKTKIETLDKHINENREINEDIKKIQTELTTIRKSTRANISASKKTFELFVEKKMNEVNSKVESNTLFIDTSVADLRTRIKNLTTNINTADENIKTKKTNIDDEYASFNRYINEIKNTYLETLNTARNDFDKFIDSKKLEVSDIFSKFTDIRNDINKRIETMSSFVTEYHKKMSAAIAGNAFSLM